jgi:hypothetical protein
MKFYFLRIGAIIGIEDWVVECELWFSGESNSDRARPPTPMTRVKTLRGSYMFFSFRSRWANEFSPIRLETDKSHLQRGEWWRRSAEGDVWCPQLLWFVSEARRFAPITTNASESREFISNSILQ